MKGLDKGKSMHFTFIKPERRTEGGLMVRSAITRFFKVDLKNMPGDAMKASSSPYEAVCYEDIFQSMYTQMVCGLYERERIILSRGRLCLGPTTGHQVSPAQLARTNS